MKDELRVTVVATGLNRSAQQGRGRDGFRDAGRDSGRDRDQGRDRDRDVRDTRESSRESSRDSGRDAMRVVKRPAAAGHDYSQLDRPAVQRFARAVGDGVGNAQVDEELLDIPAFLRRQAD
jgi:hypothetical protein